MSIYEIFFDTSKCQVPSVLPFVTFFPPPSRGAKYCGQCIFMFVCLSVCSHLKSHTSKFFRTHYMWPWLGPLVRQHKTSCTSYFMEDVMLSQNRPNDDAYVSSSLLGGGTGGEVYRLRLHLVKWLCCCVKVKNIIYHTVKDAVAVLDTDQLLVPSSQ